MIKVTSPVRFIRFMKYEFYDMLAQVEDKDIRLPECLSEWEGFCTNYGYTEADYYDAMFELTGNENMPLGEALGVMSNMLRDGRNLDRLPLLFIQAIGDLVNWAEANNVYCGITREGR